MILLDISTSYRFRHWKPMGILRVEHEVVRSFTEAFGEDVALGLYDPETDAYYRMSCEEFSQIALRNAWQPTLPSRATTATTRWRSWLRIGQMLYSARKRSRAVPGAGHKTHRLREEILAEELLRISLEEYAMMRVGLGKLAIFWPRLLNRLNQFDHLNHYAHFGLMTTLDQQLCSEAKRIDPASIRHYVSVGGFWSDNRYRYSYEQRAASGWSVHYLIYDLIPILWAHIAEPTTRKTFPLALHWALWSMDQCWTISETTKTDLITYSNAHGYPPLDPDWVQPIYLGSEVPQSDLTPEQERAVVLRHGLEPGAFVLMVGTQEPRKNHDFVYRLWRELNLRHPGQVMTLVWVGQPGWAIAPLLEMVQSDNGLPNGAIRILPDISDVELNALYRSCRYSIYASHYEGWGLPVVESLNHGKPCLTSDAPSLVEAGAGASEAIGLFEGEKWLARCFELMVDDAAYQAALERAAQFKGYDWDGFRNRLVVDFKRYLENKALASDVRPEDAA